LGPSLLLRNKGNANGEGVEPSPLLEDKRNANEEGVKPLLVMRI
jgi:hypothetical protein